MNNWHELLGILSGILWFVSLGFYIRTMVYGKTRISAISYTLWALLGYIEVAAQWSAGASWSLIMVAALALNTSILAVLAWGKYGYKKTFWGDYLCLIFAAIALVGWYVTDNPLTALILSVLANALATIPTITKTYRDPETEWAKGWFIISIASLLGIFSTEIWNAANLIAPIYTFIECVSLWALAYFGQRYLRKQLSTKVQT